MEPQVIGADPGKGRKMQVSRGVASWSNEIEDFGSGCEIKHMNTLTIDEAQRSLRSLAERALKGETVYIQADNSRLLTLQSIPPELPENYLADCYGPEDHQVEARLAAFAPQSSQT
jgi:hypothetical protein